VWSSDGEGSFNPLTTSGLFNATILPRPLVMGKLTVQQMIEQGYSEEEIDRLTEEEYQRDKRERKRKKYEKSQMRRAPSLHKNVDRTKEEE
jgi:hypothetical protein